MKLTKLNIPALRNLLRSEILNDGDKCMIDIAIFALETGTGMTARENRIAVEICRNNDVSI